MSGPMTEDPTPPEPDPEWLARFNAKMADLMAAREERARSGTEGVAAWKLVEERVDEAHEARRRRTET